MSKKQFAAAVKTLLYTKKQPNYIKCRDLFLSLAGDNSDAYYYLYLIENKDKNDEVTSTALGYLKKGMQFDSVKCDYAYARYLCNCGNQVQVDKGEEMLLDALVYLKSKMFVDDEEAKYLVAESYYYGTNSYVDHHAAVDILKKLALKKHRNAIYLLGKIYLTSNIITKQRRKGLELIKKSIDQGNKKAKLTLAVYYYDRKDYVKAEKMLINLLDFDPLVPYMLGNIYFHGFGNKKPDYAKADSLYQRVGAQNKNDFKVFFASAMNQYTIAKERIAKDCLDDIYVSATKKAIEYFIKTALDDDNILSVKYLVDIYSSFPKFQDFKEVAYYSSFLVKKGYLDYAFLLAELYETGKGVKVNQAKAYEYYRKSAEIGNKKAILKVANLYFYILKSKEAEEQAKELYEKIKKDYPTEVYYPLGMIHLRNERYSLALRCFKKAAVSGFYDAYYEIGKIYRNGLGTIDIDYRKAFINFELAFKYGVTKASFNLARMYENGEGVKKDLALALKYYVFSKEEFPAAYYHMANIYFKYGKNKSDYANAISLLKKGVDAKDGLSENKLGDLYYSGKGVERDFIEAINLYDSAKKKFVPEAMYSLGYMHYFGIGFVKNEEKGIALFNEAIEFGSKNAMYQLARIHEKRNEIEPAVELLLKAVDLGSGKAMIELGELYLKGLLTKKPNVKKANKLFLKAIEKEEPMAYYYIGSYYFKSRSGKKRRLAFEYLGKAAEKGIKAANYLYGVLLFEHKKYKMACDYLSNNYVLDDPRGFYALGMIHYHGWQVVKNEEKGLFYLKKAAELGNVYAKKIVSKF